VKKSLSNNRNIFRAFHVAVNPEDVRVIDSNEILNDKMEIWGTPNRNLDGYDDEDSMEFTGLNPEQIEGNFDDDGNVMKAENLDGDEDYAEALVAEEDPNELAMEILRQAEEKLDAARAESAQMLQDAQAEIEFAKRNAFEEGNRNGYSEGLGKAMDEIEQMRSELQAERVKLHEEYDHLVDELEPRFIDLITDIYEQVFAVELKDYTPITAHLLAKTMRASDETKNFIVRVSLDDYDYIVEHRDEIKENASISEGSFEIIKDQTLAAGACLIETDGGVFDASFDTQLANLNKKLRLLSYER
jgi:flagellar assembly protein FliH